MFVVCTQVLWIKQKEGRWVIWYRQRQVISRERLVQVAKEKVAVLKAVELRIKWIWMVFNWVSKVNLNWFGFALLGYFILFYWLKFNQSDGKLSQTQLDRPGFPARCASHVRLLRPLIGSSCGYHLLWLTNVPRTQLKTALLIINRIRGYKYILVFKKGPVKIVYIRKQC